MGVNGSDCQLSSHAKAVCDLDVECKNQETLNVVKIFWDHAKKREKNTSVKLLISKKNRTEPIVTLRWADFVSILKASLK